MRGRLWPIAVVSLCLLLLAGGIGQVAGNFTDSETSLGNSFQAWTSRLWSENTLAEFEAGIIPSQADTRSSPGDVGLATVDRVFALQGGTTSFWAYGVPADSWDSTSLPLAPGSIATGGAMAYDGARYIYAFRGASGNANARRAFWRYDTWLGTWQVLTMAPAAVGAGGALACVGQQFVYAFRGGNQNTFWQYNISGNSWTTMATAPGNVSAGGALAYDGAQYIYAFRGASGTVNARRAFWRYDTWLDTWHVLTRAPAAVGDGGALACVSQQFIYAFRGGGQNAFWQYSITGNSWTTMATAPAAVNSGGALACDGSGYFYAFQGNGTTAFWRYDALNNAWTVMAGALGNVAAGGSLAFVGASAHVNSATIASQVRDTSVGGARWDALFWDETLQLNTDITFQVRASDTLFAAGDTLPAWVSVGGTSPVTSGLPSGRYMQWRATLTTSNAAVTPVLHEVRLYHY